MEQANAYANYKKDVRQRANLEFAFETSILIPMNWAKLLKIFSVRLTAYSTVNLLVVYMQEQQKFFIIFESYTSSD